MTVETATRLQDLDDTYPAAGDYVKEGDDHLRLLKTVLKETFKGMTHFTVLEGTSTSDQAISGDTDLISLGTVNIPTKGLIMPLIFGRFLDTSAVGNILYPGIKVGASYYYATNDDNGAGPSKTGGLQEH